MAVLDIITEDVVKVPLISTNKIDIIKELIKILIDAGKIKDEEKIFQAVMNRENKGSTGLERQIAIPHAKCEEVSSLTIAIGISPEGVDFDSLDKKPSKIFFLILANSEQSGPHIKALSEIAKLASSDLFLKLFLSAKTPKEVVALLRGE